MKATVLPNPLVKRDQCVKECIGCDKMFSDENIGDVCVAYINPKGKWRNYSKVEEEVINFMAIVDVKKDKSEKIFYHINPCPLASHVKHSPKVDVIKGRSGWKKGKKW